MFNAKKPNSVVGLDIETGSIAATEVRGNGARQVGGTAIAPLEPGVISDGEVQDSEALAATLRGLFARNRLGKVVRLGVANQRVVVRTIQLPLIEDEEELGTAIRFRAQDDIPMPLDEAVLDHRVISKGNGPEGEKQMQVVAVAARRDMVASMLEAMRRAGLQAMGIDLSALGMIRALDADAARPATGHQDQLATTTLYCHLGDVTNLAVARAGECLFSRVAPFGIESIARRLADRTGTPLVDAREFLVEVGLEDPIDLFGDTQDRASAARDELDQGASKLVDELRLSIDFYGAQEGVPPIERVVVCGPGSAVPGMPERIQVGLGLGIEVEVPSALSHLTGEDAARLTVSYGLALEG